MCRINMILSKHRVQCTPLSHKNFGPGMGNLMENQHIGMTFIDFFENTIGLHVNGKAKIVENDELHADKTLTSINNDIQEEGTAPDRWIFITVEETYIHCSKHIPHLKKLDKKIH